MSEETVRPFPLLQAEASRLVRWLEDIERELNRIVQQDEWDEGNIPRLLFDTSVLIREGTFDTFNWLQIIHRPTQSVRLIIPPLVIRELDDLKNSGKVVKAGPRLRKIYKILDGHSRGPAPISGGTTLELLMDPPDCSRLENHDAEIVRRAGYLEGLPNF